MRHSKARPLHSVPTTTFDVVERDDPTWIRLRAIVDVDDADDVMDLVIDQLAEIQSEQALPVEGYDAVEGTSVTGGFRAQTAVIIQHWVQ